MTPCSVSSVRTRSGSAPGVSIYFERYGSGPQLVLVPNRLHMPEFRSLARPHRTLVLYDMRNRGRSSRVEDTSGLTIDQDVKDLEAVRRHFNADKFVPIGYSYLGAMVVLYAMGHPQHVTRIVQIGPVAPEYGKEYPAGLSEPQETMGLPDDLRMRYRELRNQENRDERAFCEVQAEVFSYLLVGNPANRTRIASHCDLENEWPVNFGRQLATHWESVKKMKIADEDLKKTTVPVLTIHGTRDRNAPYGGGREWGLRLPNARLVTIPGAAHAVYVEDPVTVWGSVRQFLRGEWPMGAERVTSLAP